MWSYHSISFVVSLIVMCRGDLPSCHTIHSENAEVRSDAPCIFPFRFKGIVHDGCTNFYDKDKKLWCSTKVDIDGNHVKKSRQWGYCPQHLSGCPRSSVDLIWDGKAFNDEQLTVRITQDGLVKKQVDKTCDENETCVGRHSCEYVGQKYKLMKKLKHEGKSQERNLIIKKLKAQVCNWKEKAFCCPHCSTSHPCLAQADCPFISQKMDKLVQLSRNSKEYFEARLDIQSYICDKDKQTFCCPQNTSSIDPLLPIGTRANRKTTQKLLSITDTQHKNENKPADIPGSPSYLPKPQGLDCGLSAKHAGFIFGGQNTIPGQFPFTALLGYKHMCRGLFRQGDKKYKTVECIKFKCGGTLINKWHVLTAAHCHGDAPSKRVAQVVLGEWEVGVDPDAKHLAPIQKFSIHPDDVTTHPEFARTKNNVINDIALIRLPRAAILNHQVQVACLPLDETETMANLRVSDLGPGLDGARPTVVGWGYTDLNPEGDWEVARVASRTQQQVEVPIVPFSQCAPLWGRLEPEKSQLCAGGERGKDSCSGDSGSGLYLEGVGERWYQVGLVSFGTRKCGTGKPGIYTRVSSFMPWIRKNLTP